MEPEESRQGVPQARETVIGAEYDGERADVALARHWSDLSRTRVSALIRDGCLSLNGRTLSRPSHPLRTEDRVLLMVPAPEPLALAPENIPLDILHEDDDLLVLNKPPGLVVHPAVGHKEGTLVHALLGHCGTLSVVGGKYRPGIVHRLDKETGGVMVVAKNDATHIGLQEQFKAHTIEKIYQALVYGRVTFDEKEVVSYIGRHHLDRKRFASRKSGGKQAISIFRVLRRFERYTLVEVDLRTGRTHQIRVHAADLGHPVVGDRMYGGRHQRGDLKAPGELGDALALIEGQVLHCATLGFVHPVTQETMVFTAPLPERYQAVIDAVEKAETPDV